MEMLYRFPAKLYEIRSVAISINLVLSDWKRKLYVLARPSGSR